MWAIKFFIISFLTLSCSYCFSSPNEDLSFRNRSVFSLKEREKSNIYTALNISLILSLYNYMTKSSLDLSTDWLNFEGKTLTKNGDLNYYDEWPDDVRAIVSIAQFSQSQQSKLKIKKSIESSQTPVDITLKNIMRDKPWHKNKMKHQLGSKILNIPNKQIKKEILLVQNYISEQKKNNLSLRNKANLELVWHDLPEIID